MSVDQARQIVDACAGRGYIYLTKLESLSAEAAAEIARHREYLTFPALRTLSPEAAAALAPFTGRLAFERLEELSDDAAAALSRSQAKGIRLPRLAKASQAAQDSLAAFPGGMSAPPLRTLSSVALAERLMKSKETTAGIVEITPAVARVLAAVPGDLRLDKLETISPEVAGVLADRPAGGLVLSGLRTLSPEVARALVRTAGPLVLNGVETVSDEVAEILAGRKDRLSVRSLREVSHPALLERLAKNDALRGVRTFPDDVLATIAAIPGQRSLDGLTELSAAQAEILSRHEGPLSLDGLTALSDEAARALLRHRGPLRLAGLRDVSSATLEAILQRPDLGTRWGQSLRVLSPTLARGLVESPVWDGNLPGITALESPDSVEIARILSTRKGPLRLPRLKRVSPRTLSLLLDAEDVMVPPVSTLDLIPEPDGGPNDDSVVPKRVEGAQSRGDR
ncbi:MAG: hypothetical protein ACK6CT_10845 [Planctomycetia bacterium]